MAQPITSKFENIQYRYYKNNQQTLIIVLPETGGNFDRHEPLLSSLNNFGDVIYIENGYFGLRSKLTDAHINNYSLTSFNSSFTHFVESTPYKNIILVTGSVGAIHALFFMQKYQNSNRIKAIIMGAPPIVLKKYKPIVAMLNILLIINQNVMDKGIDILAKIIKNNNALKSIRDVTKRIGSKSYFLCVKELIEYTTENSEKLKSIVKEKCYVLAGNKDPFFNNFCDVKTCVQAKDFKTLECGHSILVEKTPEIVEVVKTIVLQR